MRHGIALKGHYEIVCRGKNGKVKWRDVIENAIVDSAIDQILDTMFRSFAQIATASWFMALINNSPAPTLADGDTYQAHAGWVEFTGSTEATRPLWGHGAAAAKVMTNAVAVTFSINATATVHGMFICSDNTKGDSGAGPVLWGHGQFTQGNKSVASGDTLEVTYTLSGANA